MFLPAFSTVLSSIPRVLLPLAAGFLLSACGIKGGLYLPPSALPNAKPPAATTEQGNADAKNSAQPEMRTIPAAALRNPATASPADMVNDGSPY